MKRKHRSRKFWEEAVARAKASPLSRAKVAKELGVGHQALTYWVLKLRAEGQEGRGRALVPVRVIASATHCQELLELDVDGVVVRFRAGTAPEYVAQLAGALRTC